MKRLSFPHFRGIIWTGDTGSVLLLGHVSEYNEVYQEMGSVFSTADSKSKFPQSCKHKLWFFQESHNKNKKARYITLVCNSFEVRNEPWNAWWSKLFTCVDISNNCRDETQITLNLLRSRKIFTCRFIVGKPWIKQSIRYLQFPAEDVQLLVSVHIGHWPVVLGTGMVVPVHPCGVVLQ